MPPGWTPLRPGLRRCPRGTSTSINPTGVTADARFLAIGQGAMTLTPLQAANVVAVIASGQWISPTVLLGDGRERPVFRLPVTETQWQTVRHGMWAVVNEERGTADGQSERNVSDADIYRRPMPT